MGFDFFTNFKKGGGYINLYVQLYIIYFLYMFTDDSIKNNCGAILKFFFYLRRYIIEVPSKG